MGKVLVYIQSLESCTVQIISRCHKPIPHFFQTYACPFLQGWGNRLTHGFPGVLDNTLFPHSCKQRHIKRN